MLEFISTETLTYIAVLLGVFYLYLELNRKKNNFVKTTREEYYKILNSEEYKVKKQY